MTTSTADWAARYIRKYRLALVPIPEGSKGPMYEGWSLPGGYVMDAEEAQRRWSTDETSGIGAVLAPSGLCSLDSDTPEHAEPVLSALGIDLRALRKVTPTIQGNPSRYRLMFRPPPGVVLGVKKLVWPAGLPGEKPLTLFELRAGNVQDLLPPTVHPGTGKPYIWLTPPNSEFPVLPAALLELWQHWDSYRKELEAMCPWAKHGFNPEPAPRGTGARPNVIAAFNLAHPVEELLTEHGYKCRGKRWISPTSSSGLAGVTILEGRVYSHHASDPLADGHTHDAFDLYRLLDHGGEAKSAVKAAAEELGVEPESFGGNSGTSHHDKHGEAVDTTGCDTPTIQYKAGELPRNLDEAESALLVRGGVYQRGSLLVRVARIPEPRVTRSVRHHGGALTIIPLDKATLVELLTAVARWQTLDKKTKEYRAINCPKTIAEGLLARAGNWRFPVLAGIAEAPYMMEGHIYDAPGYEPRTGAYLKPQDNGFSEIPRNPTRLEAQKALRTLKEVVKDFPFVAEVDVSVWISALLTTFVRLALRSAPLFGITATVMATGKSLLADLISIIATGRRASVMSHVRDHNEEKKRLLSILMEGDPIITVDNIGEPWGSDSMAAILTAETYKDRLLGVNSVITVPTTTTWLATGNNLVFSGDLSTRVLVARLDPRCERPEDRSFDRDLLAWVPEHRAELVAACLTILASYVASGYPDVGLRPFGRFEDWSRLVRAALVWLGEPDPCKARVHIEGSDPVKQSLGATLAAWWATFKDTPKTVGQAVKSGGDELREALLMVSGDKERINLRKAGNWLAKYEGRVVEGLRFERAGTYQRSVLWRVVSVKSGEFNESGEFSHRHAQEDHGGDSIFNGRDQTHETPETHKEANGAGGDAQSMAEIRGWLQSLGEEDPETISEVLEACARDPAVMAGYLRSAREAPA